MGRRYEIVAGVCFMLGLVPNISSGYGGAGEVRPCGQVTQPRGGVS